MADWDSIRAALDSSCDVSVLDSVLSQVKHLLLDLKRRGWNAVDAADVLAKNLRVVAQRLSTSRRASGTFMYELKDKVDASVKEGWKGLVEALVLLHQPGDDLSLLIQKLLSADTLKDELEGVSLGAIMKALNAAGSEDIQLRAQKIQREVDAKVSIRLPYTEKSWKEYDWSPLSTDEVVIREHLYDKFIQALRIIIPHERFWLDVEHEYIRITIRLSQVANGRQKPLMTAKQYYTDDMELVVPNTETGHLKVLYEVLVGNRQKLMWWSIPRSLTLQQMPPFDASGLLSLAERGVERTSIFEKTCAKCGSTGRLNCSRCKLCRYCSAECQSEDWARHKEYCKLHKLHDK